MLRARNLALLLTLLTWAMLPSPAAASPRQPSLTPQVVDVLDSLLGLLDDLLARVVSASSSSGSGSGAQGSPNQGTEPPPPNFVDEGCGIDPNGRCAK
jgi:hypothetical protein